MNDDSSQGNFNTNAGHEKSDSGKEKSYTDVEARQTLDNYQKLAEPEGPDEKYMKQLEQEYLRKKDKQAAYLAFQNKHLKDGIEIGIHTEDQRPNVKEGHDQTEQKMRDDIMKEAKERYKANYSLGKNFDSKSRDKGDDMEMER